ncbi:AN1-type zinc finger protein 5-like [Grus japonensis]|uniref:AN1-type zinc finger protein 5-like n=1 Tax=Grus japonensis TaxID=30415 RepID=A0ABC9W7Y3_GRUJA
MEKTMVRQAVSLQPMEDDTGADIHLQPMEDPTLEQVDAPKGGCGPIGGPMLEQSVPEGLYPVEGTHAGAVGEELQPEGRTHVAEVRGGLSPMGGTPCCFLSRPCRGGGVNERLGGHLAVCQT